MKPTRPPGLRAAIGFLRVFQVFASLWYLAGIAVLGLRCAFGGLLLGPMAEGFRGFGMSLLFVLGFTLVFALRSGARVMAEQLELGAGTRPEYSGMFLRQWAWGVAAFLCGMGAGILVVQGLVALWFLKASGFNDARVAFAAASLGGAVPCWIALPWIWKRQQGLGNIGI